MSGAQAMSMDMGERRKAIEDFVNAEGSISFSQLTRKFPDVSEMTLRTDLKALDSERRIVRVHGGARSVGQVVGTDGLIGERRIRNVDAKRAIATKAVSLVRPDTTIYLDSGSTTTELAAVIPDMHALFLTNSVTVAVELARLENPQVIVPGGALNRYSMSLAGSRAVEALERISIDTLFLGVTSCQAGVGIGCGVDEEASLKRMLIRRSDQVIALMDSSKVDRRSTFRVCELADIDILVSDGNLPADLLAACDEAGVEVL